jgi:hypothetical protein
LPNSGIEVSLAVEVVRGMRYLFICLSRFLPGQEEQQGAGQRQTKKESSPSKFHRAFDLKIPVSWRFYFFA